MRFLERVGFVAFNQGARDGPNRGARFNGCRTGDIGNQRFAEFLRVAQIRVGLDKRFLFHRQIVAEAEHPCYLESLASKYPTVLGLVAKLEKLVGGDG